MPAFFLPSPRSITRKTDLFRSEQLHMDRALSLEAAGLTDKDARQVGVFAAIILHVLAGVILIIPFHKTSRPLKVSSISVELIPLKPPPLKRPIQKAPTPETLERVPQAAPQNPAPKTTSETSAGRQKQPERPQLPASSVANSPSGKMMKAKRFYTRAMLNAPGSDDTRLVLAQTTGDDRMIQVCNAEVMEQIANWQSSYRPDFVVPYATQDILISADTVQVEGGLFRSYGSWYQVRYNCTFQTNSNNVIAFEFLVGDKIPQSRVDALTLPYN